MSARVVVHIHDRYAYTYYGCRCAVCTAANSEHQRAANAERAARLAADPDRVPHGSVSTYKNWGCRCDECTDANKKASAEYHRRRKQQR